MRVSKVLVLSLLILSVLTSFAFAQNAENGIISGFVSSEKDSLPIADANVMAVNLMNPFKALESIAQTDSNGFYQIDSLSQGQYYLFVSADSFVSEIYDDAQSVLQAKSITLLKDQKVEGIDFYLSIAGIISGVVQDTSGNGIANVMVTATPFDVFPSSGWKDSLLSTQSKVVRTDKDGKYEINTLPTGKYRVTAKLSHAMPPQVLYWDNTDDYESATPVDVTEGIETPGIDFVFEYTTAAGIISGTVTDMDGGPLAGILVVAYNPMPVDSFYRNFPGFPQMARTDSNGNYEISGLWPGDYFVSATCWDWSNFQTKWYDNVDKYEDATPITVENGIAASGINFTFNKVERLGAISGKVVSDDDQSPVSQVLVEAMRVDTSYIGPTIRPRPALTTFTDKNGEYMMNEVLAGNYIIVVHKNNYTEFYDDVQNLKEATQIEVVAGDTTANIDFAIPANPLTGSTLSGVITDDSTGTAIEGALVAIFPVIDSTQAGNFTGNFTLFDFYSSVSNENGEYTIEGIPEGSYIATCWAPKYIVEFYDNKPDPWKADRIKVDGSEEKTGINFGLSQGWGFNFNDSLNSLAYGTVSGQVKDKHGEFISNAYVSLLDSNRVVRSTERTGPDGRYSIGSIPSGEYFLKVDRMPFSSAYYGGATDVNNATPVSVGTENNWDITSTNFVLESELSTSVSEELSQDGKPARFSLLQNYPNPFNPSTTIQYSLAEDSHVTLKIYNVRGELVRTLVNGRQSAMNHQVMWDGKNDAGTSVAAGLYIYQLKANNFSSTMRLLLLK